MNTQKGLTFKQAEEKLKIFGRNKIETKETRSAFGIFLSQFATLLNAILATAAFFSLFIHEAIDAVFILAVIFLNACFGFIQEYKAEKSLKELESLVTPKSRILRDGKEVLLLTSEIVPEDIVILSEGERIPADGKLLESFHLEIDESILTGESMPVVKGDHDSIFTGTLVMKGNATILIEKTGMNTRLGQIAQTLSTIKTDKTPLEIQLRKLGKILSILVIIITISLIPIGIAQQRSLFPLILLAISIGIAAIPEGLPAVITIALAMGTNRMAKKRAVVRRMPAIETLGSIQIILTDKTGTLTQNSMKVKKFYVAHHTLLPLFLHACIIGNTATLIQKATSHDFDVLGDKTDGALLLWSKSQGADIDQIRNSGTVIDEHPLDPATKLITSLWEKDHKTYVFVRGAPEALLAKTTLSQQEKERITNLFEGYAKEGLRVIGLAQKTISSPHPFKNQQTREEFERDLDFLGFVGLYDPPRPEAKQSVLQARQAGIQTIMVTGDNKLTALAIAKEVGMIEHDEDVITGDQLKTLTDSELEEVITKTRVFARTQPEDKLRLVTLLKKMGFVVGVTGDGVNDALALKRADVGVAMGETGTDVAKEASDIILLDDNFSTLINAVEEGRTIYSNIIKAITYLLSSNLSELSLVFLATLFGFPAPLLPTQILWINLVTDGLPALALASDQKNPHLLLERPRNPKTPILSKNTLVFILIVGISVALYSFLIFAILLQSLSESHARTVVFNILVFFQLMIPFIIKRHSLSKVNKLLVIGIIVTLLLQVVINTVPLFQRIFNLSF